MAHATSVGRSTVAVEVYHCRGRIDVGPQFGCVRREIQMHAWDDKPRDEPQRKPPQEAGYSSPPSERVEVDAGLGLGARRPLGARVEH